MDDPDLRFGSSEQYKYAVTAILDIDSLPRFVIRQNTLEQQSQADFEAVYGVLKSTSASWTTPAGRKIDFIWFDNSPLPKWQHHSDQFFFIRSSLDTLAAFPGGLFKISTVDGFRDSVQLAAPDFVRSKPIDSLKITNAIINDQHTGYREKRVVLTYLSFKKEVQAKSHYFFISIGTKFDGSLAAFFDRGAHYFNVNLPVDHTYIDADVISEIDGAQSTFFQFPYRQFGFVWKSDRDLNLELRALLPRFMEWPPGYDRLSTPVLHLVETDEFTFKYLNKINLQYNSRMVPFAEPVLVKGNLRNFFGVVGLSRVTTMFVYDELPDGPEN